jgi:uncharacterized protein involved in propanediol utilization
LSATISQRHLPKRRFDAVLALAKEHGACGIQVAHSGTLSGVLLDGNERGVSATAARVAAKARSAGFKSVTTFALNTEGMLLR